MLDILIKKGWIVDGLGKPRFRADLGIKDGKITKLTPKIEDKAERIIDAEGLIVCPGFIDAHSHADLPFPLRLTACRTADNKVMQGVTTEITGNCGMSASPLIGEARKDIRLAADIDEVDWQTFGEYLKRLERPGVSVNVASLVGHNNIRLCVVGPESRRVYKHELEEMKKLLARCMEEGAFGMSTGLVYFPGPYSDTYELIELAKVVAKCGGIYTSHQRGEKDQNIEAETETGSIGEYAKLRVHSSHQTAKMGMWGRAREYIKLRREARARGIDWLCDIDPGELYNVDRATGMLHFEHLAKQPSNEEVIDMFKDSEKREWIKRLLLNDWPPGMGSLGPFKNRRFDLMRVIQSTDKDYIGKTVEEVSKVRGDKDPFETLFNIYLEQGDTFVFHSQTVNENDIKTILKGPFSMISSDTGIQKRRDGGPYVGNPRAFSTFPRVFQKYVRGEPEPTMAWFSRPEIILTLEEAVRKMTSFPARHFKLFGRGTIQPGMYADITIFEEGNIGTKATIYNTDVYPTGIPYVIVNGEMVKDDGRHTGTLAGEVLRWRIST